MALIKSHVNLVRVNYVRALISCSKVIEICFNMIVTLRMRLGAAKSNKNGCRFG